MKWLIFFAAFPIILMSGNAFGTPTQIIYETTDLGSGRWEYTYTVTNFSPENEIDEIQEFTIWFGYDEYDNPLYGALLVTTPETPTGWDQLVWEP